jgi:hypothetical protein
LSRPAVEGVGCGIEISLGEHGEVGAFREVLAEEAVRVLVRSALPWALRVAEVDLDTGIDRELGVVLSSY